MASECMTCRKLCVPLQKNQVKSLLCENETMFASVNPRPNSKAHTVIMTKRHCEDLRDMTAQEWDDALPILKESIKKIDAVYHPIGYRINMSIGELGGANQPPHFYLRIVPRYKENYGSYGGGIYHDRLPSSEQKKRLCDALQPNQDKVVAEKGKLIAKLHDDIGFMSISTKQRLPNNLQTLDAEIWSGIYKMCQEMMKKIEAKKDCHNFTFRIELGETSAKMWKEEAKVPYSYDYLDSELVVNLFPKYILKRFWLPDEGREIKNKQPVGTMENERIAEKLNDPEEYAKTWGKEPKQETNSQTKSHSAETSLERERENVLKQPSFYWGLAAGGLIIACLGGLGVYYFINKKKLTKPT